jgi:hypothetical protein
MADSWNVIRYERPTLSGPCERGRFPDLEDLVFWYYLRTTNWSTLDLKTAARRCQVPMRAHRMEGSRRPIFYEQEYLVNHLTHRICVFKSQFQQLDDYRAVCLPSCRISPIFAAISYGESNSQFNKDELNWLLQLSDAPRVPVFFMLFLNANEPRQVRLRVQHWKLAFGLSLALSESSA